jgi:LAO/AO transport system kinase
LRTGHSGFNALTNKSIALTKQKTDVFFENQGRRPRILVTAVAQKIRTGITQGLAALFSEAGFDVDISLLPQAPHEVAKTATENDVDLICIATSGDVDPDLPVRLSDALKKQTPDNVVIIAGSEISASDDPPRRSGIDDVVDIDRLDVDVENWLKQATGAPRIFASKDDYIDGIVNRDRRIVAKTITLIESTHADHRHIAKNVLEELVPLSGDAIRIGISGIPGAGKSSFIESFGMMLSSRGHQIAVLAVDPSSAKSGGSIMGDKTRMKRLAVQPQVFIRPSPAGGKLGGVARKTRESIIVCDAAGFDVIVVETVGVGQSEVAVASMVDFFLLMLVPGAGDEIQGIKRGIVEFADAVVISKADGENIERAQAAKMDYQAALSVICPPSRVWSPPVLTCSAHNMDGIDAIWEVILDHRKKIESSGELAEKRKQQALDWMWDLIEEGLMDRFYKHPLIAQRLPEMIEAVASGEKIASAALYEILSLYE